MNLRVQVLIAFLLLSATSIGACNGTGDGPGPGPGVSPGPGDGLTAGSGGAATRIPGSGSIVTESRPVSGFDEIELAGEGTVAVTLGEEFSLGIETDDNLMQYLETAVQGTRLVMRTTGDGPVDIEPTHSIVWTVTMPEVRRATISGAGTIDLPSLDIERFEAVIGGVGDINLPSISAEYLTATVTGVGTIRAAGTADTVDLSVAGPGTIDAGDLASTEATCAVDDAGAIVVWAIDRLNLSIAGLGSVSVYGSPEVSGDTSGVVNLGDR